MSPARSELFQLDGMFVDPLDSDVPPSWNPDPAAIALPPTTSLSVDILGLLHEQASSTSGLDWAASRLSSAVDHDSRIEPILALISHSVAGAVGILELPHLRVLVLLSQKDSMSVAELATLMNLRSRAAFELLNVMEDSGWIGTDAPARGLGEKIAITQQGRIVVDSVTAGRQREIDEILGRLSETDRLRLANAFNAFAMAARERPLREPKPGVAP